ncbi:hypothetical protein [Nocardia brasiliensis]|uniref:hypothetical protein n=1 Tax=Nocardia brasiliensis TaxID=37326 RepID=UPI0004A71624|nr:hypothetical protein [Nocardia brasiliensis]
MNASTLPGYVDCFADPGALSGDAAVYALAIHHACPGQCLPRLRAETALDAEYETADALAQPSAYDEMFAEQVRTAMHLTENAIRSQTPGLRPSR